MIRAGIVRLADVLKARAVEFKHTPIIGRTHGVHAEPTTFGLKLLLWYSEVQRILVRFDAAAEDLRVGKLSGAVGTFGHLKPEHEEAICAALGLKPVAVATQVIQRDRHAAYVSVLAVLASHAGQDRDRGSAPAAHRGSRGGGVLLREAEGLVGDAAQAQPHHQRADQRPGARDAGKRAGGARERGACGMSATSRTRPPSA